MYAYDVIYQLVFVDYNDGNSTDYFYDSLGNRTDVNESGTITSYSRNELNQYTSVGGASYSYDDNGNLFDDGTYQHYYDCENRLTDVNEKARGGGSRFSIYDLRLWIVDFRFRIRNFASQSRLGILPFFVDFSFKFGIIPTLYSRSAGRQQAPDLAENRTFHGTAVPVKFIRMFRHIKD